MFSTFAGSTSATAKLIASDTASLDSILSRGDFQDHINENCQALGLHTRHLLNFANRQLPRLLAAVQRPAGSSTTNGDIKPTNLSATAREKQLLMAANATAVLVRVCQNCTPPASQDSDSDDGGSVHSGGRPRSGANPYARDVRAPSIPENKVSPLTKIVPVVVSILGRRTSIPDSVSLDVQRILLAAIESDHEQTVSSINMALKPDVVRGAARHLVTSAIIGETLVSLFGSALHAKAMMTTVKDSSIFVSRWVSTKFPLMLVTAGSRRGKTLPCGKVVSGKGNALHQAMRKSSRAPYFFFFHEVLKRAFSPNIGPLVDEILKPAVFGPLVTTVFAAAEKVFIIHLDEIPLSATEAHPIRLASSDRKGCEEDDNEESDGDESGSDEFNIDDKESDGTNTDVTTTTSAAVSRSNSSMNRKSESSKQEGGGGHTTTSQFLGCSSPLPTTISRRYPLLSEGMSLVYNCVGIVRRSLPPAESESIYVAKKQVLNHAPLRIILEQLPRLVSIIRSSLPPNFKAAFDPAGDRRTALRLKWAEEDGLTTKPLDKTETGNERRSFTLTRLTTTEIIVELVLFRSKVCDEALVSTGAIDALLDVAEAFPNHDLLMRNVHRVIMAVLQRPAFSAISLASNVAAAHNNNTTSVGNSVNTGRAGNANTKQELTGSFSGGSFSSNPARGPHQEGEEMCPSFSSVNDFNRQFSSAQHPNSASHEDPEGHGSFSMKESPLDGTQVSTDAAPPGETNAQKQLRRSLEEEHGDREQANNEIQKMDVSSRLFVTLDPLMHFFTCKRPISSLLYTWCSDIASHNDDSIDAPSFRNTSLQAHATQILAKLRDVSSLEFLRKDCSETICCDPDVSQRISVWQQPNTGERFFQAGSGSPDLVVHRPLLTAMPQLINSATVSGDADALRINNPPNAEGMTRILQINGATVVSTDFPPESFYRTHPPQSTWTPNNSHSTPALTTSDRMLSLDIDDSTNEVLASLRAGDAGGERSLSSAPVGTSSSSSETSAEDKPLSAKDIFNQYRRQPTADNEVTASSSSDTSNHSATPEEEDFTFEPHPNGTSPFRSNSPPLLSGTSPTKKSPFGTTDDITTEGSKSAGARRTYASTYDFDDDVSPSSGMRLMNEAGSHPSNPSSAVMSSTNFHDLDVSVPGEHRNNSHHWAGPPNNSVLVQANADVSKSFDSSVAQLHHQSAVSDDSGSCDEPAPRPVNTSVDDANFSDTSSLTLSAIRDESIPHVDDEDLENAFTEVVIEDKSNENDGTAVPPIVSTPALPSDEDSTPPSYLDSASHTKALESGAPSLDISADHEAHMGSDNEDDGSWAQDAVDALEAATPQRADPTADSDASPSPTTSAESAPRGPAGTFVQGKMAYTEDDQTTSSEEDSSSSPDEE